MWLYSFSWTYGSLVLVNLICWVAPTATIVTYKARKLATTAITLTTTIQVLAQRDSFMNLESFRQQHVQSFRKVIIDRSHAGFTRGSADHRRWYHFRFWLLPSIETNELYISTGEISCNSSEPSEIVSARISLCSCLACCRNPNKVTLSK